MFYCGFTTFKGLPPTQMRCGATTNSSINVVGSEAWHDGISVHPRPHPPHTHVCVPWHVLLVQRASIATAYVGINVVLYDIKKYKCSVTSRECYALEMFTKEQRVLDKSLSAYGFFCWLFTRLLVLGIVSTIHNLSQSMPTVSVYPLHQKKAK